MGNQPSATRPSASATASTADSAIISAVHATPAPAVPQRMSPLRLKNTTSRSVTRAGIARKASATMSRAQCFERWMREDCTREIGKEKLAGAIAEENKNKSKDKVVDGGKSKDSTKGKGEETAVERKVANDFAIVSDASNVDDRMRRSASKDSEDAKINMDEEIAANLAADNDSDTSPASSVVENSVHYSNRDIPAIDDPHAANHDNFSNNYESSSSSSSFSSELDINDNDSNARPSLTGVMIRRQTRRQQATNASEAAEKLQADLAAAQPIFIFQLPLALQRWDYKKCNRCRYTKNCDCNGETPCDRCVKDNILVYRPCTRIKGKADFEEQKEEAREKQKDRWDDNREVAEIREREKGQKRQKEILRLEIDLSKAQDVARKAKGAKLKAARETNAAVKKVNEIRRREGKAEMERALKESCMENEVGDEADVEMKDGGDQDEGYQTQANPDLGAEGGDEGAEDTEMDEL